MAVLDTLYVLFKGDATNLIQTTAEVEKDTQKINKTLEETKDIGDELGATFATFAGSLKSALLGALSVAGFTAGIKSASDYAFSLSNLSTQLQLNVSDLDVWGNAVESIGGRAEDLYGSAERVTDQLRELARTGMTETLPFFNFLNINLRNSNGTVKNFIELLPELSDRFQRLGKIKSDDIGKRLGLDEKTILLLQRGGRELDEIIKKQKEFGVVTAQQAEIAKKFNLAWTDTTNDISHGFRTFFMAASEYVLPTITEIVKKFDWMAAFIARHSDLIKGALIAIAGVLTYRFLPAMISVAIASAPFILLATVLAALGIAFAFLYDDIVAFKNGNKSLIGYILEHYPKVLEVFNKLADWAGLFNDAVEGLGRRIVKVFNLIIGLYDKVKNIFGGDSDLKASIDIGKQAIDSATNSPLAYQTTNSILNNGKQSQKTNNINIGDITIQTTALDPATLTGAFTDNLKNEMRNALGNFDDGVMI